MAQSNDICDMTFKSCLSSPQRSSNIAMSVSNIPTNTYTTSTTNMMKMIDMSNDSVSQTLLHPFFDNESKLDTSIDDNDMTSLLSHLYVVSEDVILAEQGYKKVSKMRETMQGQLHKAERLNTGDVTEYIAIKTCSKVLHEKGEAMQDGMNFIISENIIKEALILKHLTLDNQPIGSYITRFVDFFESEEYYYLVMEYIESEMNLRQFIQTAFKYIHAKKLELSHYQKMMKYLFWQLLVTIRWMHHDMNCCHLDLCLENIMLENCDFIQQPDGTITINRSIRIKLSDFGVAEIFGSDNFQCIKRGLTLDNEDKLAPQIFQNDHDIYDAGKADIWSLGIILFESMTGQELYKSHEIWNELSYKESGYWAIQNNKLPDYLLANDLLKYFKWDCVSLLFHLLNVHESDRYSADDVMKHKWFNAYFNRNQQQIYRKSKFQKKSLLKQCSKMITFPYYILP